MELPLYPPPPEVMREDVRQIMSDWIAVSDSLEIINYLGEQFRTAYSYRLIKSIMDYSGYFDADDEVTEGQGPRVFTQGMLFGMGIAYEWLDEVDLRSAVTFLGETAKSFGAAGSLATDEDQEEPDWPTVLLEFGQEGLDMAIGYRPLVIACMWKIEKNDHLHDYFMAGAGLMMRIALARRHIKRNQEIKALEEGYGLSGGTVVRNAGGLAVGEVAEEGVLQPEVTDD